MLYRKKNYISEEDFNLLLSELLITDPQNISEQDKYELIYIMIHTEYTNLRGKIAIFLSDSHDIFVLPVLIKLIKENIHTKYIGSLIYASSQFDCGEYIELFVDIIIVKDDMTVLDAFSTIENIKSPIDLDIKNYCVNKLLAFKNLFNEEDGECTTILQTIELINSLKVKALG